MSTSTPDDELMQRQQSADLGHPTGNDKPATETGDSATEAAMNSAARKAREQSSRKRRRQTTLADR